ncbi:hypothetical protein MHYP_G00081200 [Metynnis hypsauchen]
MLASTMVGMVGLCGLVNSLAWIPLCLPLFCFHSCHLWHLHSGQDAGVGGGVGAGLLSRPQTHSSSLCYEFNSKNEVLPMSSRNSWLHVRFKTDVQSRSFQLVEVCDIVRLATSPYRRKTPYIRVPTNLLSYIDASIAAKTVVNLCSCKNKLGFYTPPTATFLDRSFLRNLPRRHISSGMAEMLKYSIA